METTHSTKFEEVKGYYDKLQWSKRKVKNAVKAGWITAEEYEEITGGSYV